LAADRSRGDNTYFFLNLQKTTGNALPVVFHFWQDPSTFAAYVRVGPVALIPTGLVSIKSQCIEKGRYNPLFLLLSFLVAAREPALFIFPSGATALLGVN
jgi:hypothetical protein